MYKVVVAGKNNIAINVLEYILSTFDSIDVKVIFNQNDKGIDGFQRSFKKYCLENNIESITLENAEKIKDVIFLSLEFDKIVSPNKFNSDRLFNIHFSLLPKYKGMYTSAWPILNLEKSTGVTLHKIDAGIDTGDIIQQVEFDISENETSKTLYAKYIMHGTSVVIDNIFKIFDNCFFSTSQSAVGSSYYSRNSIDYSNLKINLNKTAYEIKKQLDAFNFRDYQLPKVFGYNICGAKILSEKSQIKPGCLISEDGSGLILSTIDYNICLYKDILDDFLIACSEGNIDFVINNYNEYVINEKNSNGWSPIIVAAYHGKIDVVELLVSLGANINDTNYKGTSVFMYVKDYAIKNKDINYIRSMIRLGANVNLSDCYGKSVFDYLNGEEENFIKNAIKDMI
ncbi:TPA: formyl transferase [Vibrio vulnificus]|nr:formyl transferase [Vibrio vulnificus]